MTFLDFFRENLGVLCTMCAIAFGIGFLVFVYSGEPSEREVTYGDDTTPGL